LTSINISKKKRDQNIYNETYKRDVNSNVTIFNVSIEHYFIYDYFKLERKKLLF